MALADGRDARGWRDEIREFYSSAVARFAKLGVPAARHKRCLGHFSVFCGTAALQLPGSHRHIMEHWGRTLRPERLPYLPRTHGLRPVPEPDDAAGAAASLPRQTGREGLEAIPELLAAGQQWALQQPIAAEAVRGQVFIHTGSVLHSAWHNQRGHSRKAILISWNDVPPSLVNHYLYLDTRVA